MKNIRNPGGQILEARNTTDFGHLSYALLYVVIEGFTELGIEEEFNEIEFDEKRFSEDLKKFRNAVFHVKKSRATASDVTFKCLDDEDFLPFIEKSYIALNNYFHIKIVKPIVDKTKEFVYKD